MINRWYVCVLIAFVCAAPLAAETPAGVAKYGNTPLVFEPNYGQADSTVRFLSRGDRYGLFLTDTEAVVSLAGPTPALVQMQLVGQNPHPQISGSGSQPGTSHYIKGADAAGWQQSVPHFLRVDYRGVYPGIDLSYYGNQRQLEYDFTVGPHANPKAIELKFSGVERIEIGTDGDLILHTGAGEIRHQRPYIYQDVHGTEKVVEGHFVLHGAAKVGFEIGAYDSALPLVIDPKFVYSTYFGGAGANGDIGIDVKVDAFGAAYVTGYTSSLDFFTTNLSSTGPGGGNLDAFVMKVDPTGATVLSAMYFGGSADDEGHRIALDSIGDVFITGYTSSTDFPIVNGFQTKIGGRKDAYIAKINNAVTQLLFSSYIGGSLNEQPFGLSVDTTGNIYIAGETLSNNFPLVKPIRNAYAGGLADGFVMKLSPSGTVIYSTYLGGRGNDRAFDVTSDADGNAFIVGFTSSVDFPVSNALVASFSGGSEDAFVTKLSPDGSAYLISTFFGGTGTEEAVRVVVDSEGNVIVSGYTTSQDFPIKNPIQAFFAGGFDIFVTKFTPDLRDSTFSTYIGSDGSESAPGLAVDAAGNIYISGFTSSFSFPVVNGINIGTGGGFLRGDRDAYVMKLLPSGSILFSTYIGGSSSDGAVGMAVDGGGNIYVTGYSLSSDFPVVNAFQPANAEADSLRADGILLKISADDIRFSSPLAIPSKGGVTLTTVGANNSVIFGHATFNVAAGAKLPAGLAIMDLRQIGSEVGETAFPLLPFITDGRVYINEDGTHSTNLAIVNPSDDSITMYFFMTSRDGIRSGDGSATIPAKSRFAQSVTGSPFFLPSGANGTLTFSTTAPVAALAFRSFGEANNATLFSYLPIADPYSVETRPITIPQYASDLGWRSEFLLVNPSDSPISGQVVFYNNGPNEGDPTQSSTNVSLLLDRGELSSVPYSLEPYTTDSFSTSPIETTVSGYAQIVPDAGTVTPQATVFLRHTDGNGDAMYATVEGQIPVTSSRLYAELDGDFDNGEGHSTALAFAISNPAATPTTVTLTLVNMDGTTTGLASTFTLPAQGHIATFLHRMDAFKNIPKPFQGLLLVNATGPGVVLLGLRGRVNEFGDFVGTTTGPIKENPGSGTSVIFPLFLDGGGYATQFILFNDPSLTQGTAGTIEFANENGVGLPLTIQ